VDECRGEAMGQRGRVAIGMGDPHQPRCAVSLF
jgi:hypothetical protein